MATMSVSFAKGESFMLLVPKHNSPEALFPFTLSSCLSFYLKYTLCLVELSLIQSSVFSSGASK